MKINETVQVVREMTKPQFKDIIGTVVGAVPDNLTFDEAKLLTSGKGFLLEDIREMIWRHAKGNAFLRSTAELTIEIPALPRPTLKDLQAKFPMSGIMSIERDTSPTDAVTLKLATVLRTSEECIPSEEYELRLASKLNIVLGYQHAAWLAENQDKLPELNSHLRKFHIGFPGIVVVSTESSFRNYSGLDELGIMRWSPHWCWINDGFHRRMRIAVSDKCDNLRI